MLPPLAPLKKAWIAAHPDVKTEELSQQDLAPYLDKDFWKKAVAGEVYLIYGIFLIYHLALHC